MYLLVYTVQYNIKTFFKNQRRGGNYLERVLRRKKETGVIVIHGRVEIQKIFLK